MHPIHTSLTYYPRLTTMKLAWTAFTFALTATSVFAGHELTAPGKETKAVVEPSPFEKGRHEFQLGLGYNFAINSDTATRPDIQDLNLYARYGWMLTSPSGGGIFRGNLELLAELFVGGVTSGPGDIMAGASLLLRYNFVQENSKWVPYFQIGVGGVYSDIYEDKVQRLVGQAIEFNLQGGFGLRYLINNHLAAYLEANYRHISNADTADRNNGLNSIGVQAGVSWFF